MGNYDECINVSKDADPFKNLDGIMRVIIRLDIDPQEIIDHVENFIENMCPSEMNNQGIYTHIIDEIGEL